ncbi:unnamed protein product [Oikopleura dioica]|uniref:Uncharacterized protein n=1 Tax=Oikopleura dioica TaxID=34765 RepID=E4WYK1_OIKDI|nr:unnamed protein product [Oikopleura dioica]
MSAPAKKRKLSIFSLPKTEKEAKKISRLLIELQKDYFVNSLELEYEDENATGWIRCSGECTNKNKPFSAKGARQLICSEKIQRHMKNYHTLKNDSKSGAKKLKKEDIEEIQTSSARIIAQKSLSKGFYDSPEVKRRDELLITASGGERGTGEKLGLSRYKCEKLWKSSQHEMKKMIAKVGPTLIEKGYLSIIIDHKSIKNHRTISKIGRGRTYIRKCLI